MKKILLIVAILTAIGASYPAAKTKWDNWAGRTSSGVALPCTNNAHKIKFYHANGKFSVISLQDNNTSPNADNLALYLNHKSGRPMLQVVDPSTKRVHQIDLVSLALSQQGNESPLPWGATISDNVSSEEIPSDE